MADLNFMTEATAKEILSSLRLVSAYTKIYLEGLEIDSWAALVEISKSGKANTVMQVGDVIESTYTVGTSTYSCPWVVVAFRDVELEDGTSYENVPIIQMLYTGHENIVFDPEETTEATEEIAQEGYYYCGFDGTNYTMLGLAAGAAIPYGSYTKVYKSLWNSANAIRYGLNNWRFSWARQYLNHSGTGWAEPQHACDVLPSGAADKTGFMSYLPQDMVSALHPIKIKTRRANYMGGGYDETFDTFWLPATSEINIYNGNADPEDGEPWPYYKELLESEEKLPAATYAALKKYAVNALTSAQTWWLRSCLFGYNYEWVVLSSGNVYNYYPRDGYRLAPACAII